VGWRVLTVWECSLKGSDRKPASEVLTSCKSFILGPRSRGNRRSRMGPATRSRRIGRNTPFKCALQPMLGVATTSPRRARLKASASCN
jgi:hypothetical protein